MNQVSEGGLMEPDGRWKRVTPSEAKRECFVSHALSAIRSVCICYEYSHVCVTEVHFYANPENTRFCQMLMLGYRPFSPRSKSGLTLVIAAPCSSLSHTDKTSRSAKTRFQLTKSTRSRFKLKPRHLSFAGPRHGVRPLRAQLHPRRREVGLGGLPGPPQPRLRGQPGDAPEG